jgi:hypothetical protein
MLYSNRFNFYRATTSEIRYIDISWWQRIPHNEPRLKIPDQRNIAKILKVFPQFLVIGFLHSLFSAIESSFRIYVRELDPNVCNKGTADFKSIYDYLFKKLRLQQRKDYTDLLDLLRLIRNTIHNNGVYFHPDGKSKTVTYQGKQYMFDNGKHCKVSRACIEFFSRPYA